MMMPVIAQPTCRFLVVDDDEGVRQTFAGILRLEGHQVRTASNAQEALHEVETFHPDAILLDLRMPMVNGFGFLYRLRALSTGRAVPVAMITADCSLDDEATQELEELGADLWQKPLWTEELLVVAGRLLSRTAFNRTAEFRCEVRG
jgi:DNA-binding response OmpR family regulator